MSGAGPLCRGSPDDRRLAEHCGHQTGNAALWAGFNRGQKKLGPAIRAGPSYKRLPVGRLGSLPGIKSILGRYLSAPTLNWNLFSTPNRRSIIHRTLWGTPISPPTGTQNRKYACCAAVRQCAPDFRSRREAHLPTCERRSLSAGLLSISADAEAAAVREFMLTEEQRKRLLVQEYA
jgi:hypothetical protein